MDKQTIVADATKLFAQLIELDEEERIDTINEIRQALHEHSPMKEHPVDCVLWINQSEVEANAYNPNVVAPPEMELLRRSISHSGYTQPCVVWNDREEHYEIVDGKHRSDVAREIAMYGQLHGRLPVTVIRANRTDLPARYAATVEHNRARGTHGIDEMQKLVAELVEVGMSDTWIMQYFGMDVDELLRLKQLTGLAALFGLDAKKEFSQSWEAADENMEGYIEEAFL